MGVEESKAVREVLEDLAESTQKNYKATLKQLLQFANSKEGLKKKISIDNLIMEAKGDVTKIQDRIDLFYKWLQGEKVEGYALRLDDEGKLKTMRESSANQRAYGYLRGFFVNVGIGFTRKWKKKIPKVERKDRATKKDEVYTFYDVDEETKTIRFNREQMEQFLANLKLRDVAITLALLSSSQDTVDLFSLSVGDIREQSSKSRIFWEGNRKKTGILFRTFISKEATKFIWKYIEQERKGAEDDAPLFVARGQRMTGTNLSSIYRDAARRMGIKWENGEHNPLRPKRMRHLFRTACDAAEITELYTNCFMGHKNHQGQDYSQLTRPMLELQYLTVEPLLTVYGEVQEALEIKEDVRKLEQRILDLNKTIVELQQTLESKVETIARHVFPELLKEDRAAIEELKQWREEFAKRYEKDVKE